MNHETEQEILEEFRDLKRILRGDADKLGLLAEHRIMWRVHVWALCTLSGGLGITATLVIQRIVK